MSSSKLVDRVKETARGRWLSLLSTVGGCSTDILDGKHHPCPLCGGTDRFRLIDADAGAVLCNNCFHERNGDGLAAIGWLRGWDFKSTLDQVADALGVPHKVKHKPDDDLELLPWNEALVYHWTQAKPGITPEALQAAGGGLARWHGEVVVHVPILPPGEPAGKPTGYVLWNSTGGTLARKGKPDKKMLCTPGSAPGWIGRHGLEVLASPPAAGNGTVEPTVWKTEGPTDLLALWAAVPEADRLHVAILSNAFGSTEKPHKELLETLRGRQVIVIHDEDEAGLRGGERWAREAAGVAAEVRRVRLPQQGQDVRDYLTKGGGTWAGLQELAAAAPPLSSVTAPARVRNFTVEELETSDGGVRLIYHAVPIATIAQELFTATDGWPKVYGNDLFIEDKDGRIEILQASHDLFAYLQRMCPPGPSGGGVYWRDHGADVDGASFVTRHELFSGLRSMAQRFTDVADYPFEPPPRDVYISRKWLDVGDDKREGALKEFCGFFRPAAPEDEALVFALVLTVLWGGSPGGRPFFFISGPDGTGAQETGKTSFVEHIASLVGGTFRVELSENMRGDDLRQQILSDEALHRRVVLLDNLDGYTGSRELAELLTAQSIDGRPVFGRQRSRQNYLTWVGTAVSPDLNSDLASRTFSLQLTPPDRNVCPTWSLDVAQFVSQHRGAIIHEATDLLRNGKRHRILAGHSRFPAWDRAVLALHPRVNEVLAGRGSRLGQIDSDLEGLALFLECLKRKQPKTYLASELADVWTEATKQKVTAISLGKRLKAYESRGNLPLGLVRIWKRRHGSPWSVNPEDLDLRSMNEREPGIDEEPGEGAPSPGEGHF